ncbi:MAG TPA: acyltransferase [Thermoleophilaceae bacterium]|jgi:peptidoglycan/LPS O-acetylase OafA/YrhL
MPSSERGRRAAGLDGLRALAALSVVCFHVWLYRFPDPTRIRQSGLFDDVLSDFRLGLILFFVLSGYLLYRGFARAALRQDEPVNLGVYALRRSARILPAYYLAMLGTFALLWGARSTPGVRLPDGGDLALFAFFGQNYSTHTILTFNPVTWTLCLEVLFYALLPLLGAIGYRWSEGRARRQAALLLGLIGFGLAWNAGVYLLGGNMLAGKALPAYLPYFALGMLLALWVERSVERHGQPPRVGPLATLALLVAGIAGVVCNGIWHASAAADAVPLLTGAIQNLPAGIGFAALLAAVVVGRGPATAWIHARPLALIGLVSYGIYLWHVPLMLFGVRFGLLPHAFVPRLFTVLVPAVLAGTASWLLVERVMLAHASRMARRSAKAGSRRVVTTRLDARTAP